MLNQYTFTHNGCEYTIDNTAYSEKAQNGVYFEVQKCPKCKKTNGPGAFRCSKCGTELSEDSIRIAHKKSRSFGGFLVGALLYAIITSATLWGMRLRLGAIPTVIVLGICFAIGKAIMHDKIVIDSSIDNGFIKSVKSKRGVKLPTKKASELKVDTKIFTLVKQCNSCGQKTEKDSVYCSNCGHRM